MACPTCNETMQSLNEAGRVTRHFWCPRCGTLKTVRMGSDDDAQRPKLVARVHRLRQLMADRVGFSNWDVSAWTQTGIFEAIALPHERRDTPTI